MTKDETLFRHLRYIKRHGKKKKLETLGPVINYMQWLILYSNQNDDIFIEWQLLR